MFALPPEQTFVGASVMSAMAYNVLATKAAGIRRLQRATTIRTPQIRVTFQNVARENQYRGPPHRGSPARLWYFGVALILKVVSPATHATVIRRPLRLAPTCSHNS
jgi:hypothetical protein